MLVDVNGKIGCLVLGAMALIIPSSVSADEIALTFEASNFTVTGEFAGFVQNAYVIKTENGDLHVPVEMVTCEGNDCFEFSSADEANG